MNTNDYFCRLFYVIMEKKSNVFIEVTPLQEKDCFYIAERMKDDKLFPIHSHIEYELEYMQNAEKAIRVVGDSIEEIGKYELILITNENLEHGWKKGNCSFEDVYELTIQFRANILPDELLDKNQFKSIKLMFDKARKGILFPIDTILKVKPLLISIAHEKNGFYSVITLYTLLYELSKCKNIRTLASSSYTKVEVSAYSRRIKSAVEYIELNYAKEINMNEVANVVNMSTGAFGRLFKLQTGKSFTDFLTDFRIGHTTRLLTNSNLTIPEICDECGYNNVSNFNRIFRKKKKCSPTEFREIYRKNQNVI